MDVLSDVLRVADLGNALLTQADLVAPWAMQIGPKAHPSLHVVRRGLCWLCVPGREPVRLTPGDIVFVPTGALHVMADDPDSPASHYLEVLAEQRERVQTGVADAARCGLLCAQILFDHHEAHPLLSVLPELIHIPADAAETDEALRAMARVLVREAAHGGAGSELIVPRMIDTLLVLVVRHWLAAHPADGAGWLGALRDKQVGRALGLMHQRPHDRWTIEALAAEVAMSRASFARRFTTLVGEPPLAYLTKWRLSLAARRLRTGDEPVEQVAAAVGYESVTSFGSAFRRRFSLAPGQYRAQLRAARQAANAARG